MAEYQRRLRALNPGMDVLNEGNHVHLEPSPWSAESLARYGYIRR